MAKKIDTVDHDYAEQISNFVNVGDSWLDTKFWVKQ